MTARAPGFARRSSTSPRLAASLLVALCLVLGSGAASAQVHWDAGGEAGVTRRFAAGVPAGAPSPGFGPSLQLQGHVALLPMVRLGAYLASDLSPAGADGQRTFWAGGLHARLTPPLLPWPWRAWLAAGFGYAFADDLGTHATGGLLEVPLALGLGRKLGRHWVLYAELGARLGFAFHGPMYDAAGAPAGTSAASGAGGTGAEAAEANRTLGKDAFALSLSVGLSFDE